MKHLSSLYPIKKYLVTCLVSQYYQSVEFDRRLGASAALAGRDWLGSAVITLLRRQQWQHWVTNTIVGSSYTTHMPSNGSSSFKKFNLNSDFQKADFAKYCTQYKTCPKLLEEQTLLLCIYDDYDKEFLIHL